MHPRNAHSCIVWPMPLHAIHSNPTTKRTFVAVCTVVKSRTVECTTGGGRVVC